MVIPKFSSGSSLSLAAVVLLVGGLGIAIFASQQQQDQRSKAAELVVIADSVADFSGSQGNKGWHYGFTNGDYVLSNFQEMQQFKSTDWFGGTGNAWFVEDGKYWTSISSKVMHPNADISGKGRTNGKQTAVRRWVSNYAGKVEIKGSVWDNLPFGSGGDGLGLSIRIDGDQKYAKWISETDSTHHNFDFFVDVNVGTSIDFAAISGGNDWTDHLYMTAQILKSSPDIIAPSTPTGLTATATSTSQINLTWNASTDAVGVTGYKVYRNGNQTATVTGTSYQDTGLTADTTYTYEVSARDAAGNESSRSNQASAKTQKPLLPTTKLQLDLFLHGIGKAGDSANPGEPGGGNIQLVHFQRPIMVSLVTGEQVRTIPGLAVYNAQSGSFKATVEFDDTTEGFEEFTSGVYAVSVKFEQSLNTLVPPGFQTITKGTLNTIPKVSLVTGDINNDNRLNIIDYDILRGCYSDFEPAKDCTPAKKIMADIDDDGSVNHTDLTLFLRELSVQGGH